MTIPQCPTCGGEGWITLKGKHHLSYYIGLGWLKKVPTDTGETVQPTGQLVRHGLPDGEPEPVFQQCWCNHQILHLSRKIGEPLYWMRDGSGQCQRVVKKVWGNLHHDQLNAPLLESEIHFLRAYVAQWVLGVQHINQAQVPSYRPRPITEWLPAVAQATTPEDFIRLDQKLNEWGLDPF
jgi:hypothetical protein